MKEDAPIILYVASGRRPEDETWTDLCARAGLRVESVSDVYLALARIGQGRIEPDAVLVCVDSLDQDEYEFFGLVSRYYRETAVYACGGPISAERLESAMDAGARGIVDPERMDEFVAEIDRRPIPRTPAVPPGQIVPEEFASVPLPAPPPDPDPIVEVETEVAPPPPQPVDPPTEPEMAVQEEQAVVQELIEEPPEPDTPEPDPPSSEIPMPWRARDRGPTRTPPTRVAPDSNGSRPDRTKPAPAELQADETPPEADASSVDGPLLTPEELHLLIDDDVRLQPMLPDEAEDEEEPR